MVQIDPDCWLIKELDFEKPAEENLFQLRACLVRPLPAQCRPGAGQAAKDKPRGQDRPLRQPGRKRSRVSARTEMVTLIAGGVEGSAPAAAGRRDPPQPALSRERR